MPAIYLRTALQTLPHAFNTLLQLTISQLPSIITVASPAIVYQQVPVVYVIQQQVICFIYLAMGLNQLNISPILNTLNILILNHALRATNSLRMFE